MNFDELGKQALWFTVGIVALTNTAIAVTAVEGNSALFRQTIWAKRKSLQ